MRFINDSAAEELLVNRRIPRKGASSVSCTLYRGGKQVVTDEAVQPSVDAYNRYILDKLGITRDELLNNFILSKYRYEDFLSSSDKEKKEVINRFSNGILVDEAIAKVEEDIVPLSEKKRQVELELAGLDGRIGMLQEQIRKEEEAGAERGRTRVERIMGLETAIAAKREQIRTGHENVDRLEEQLAGVQRADEALQDVYKRQLDVLLAVRDMLVSAADHDIHVTLAEGNHDKVNQESLRGYCHVFDRHPNVTVVDEYLTLCRRCV